MLLQTLTEALWDCRTRTGLQETSRSANQRHEPDEGKVNGLFGCCSVDPAAAAGESDFCWPLRQRGRDSKATKLKHGR